MSIKPMIIGNATLYHGDCMEIMPTLDKVDAVITDPPYSERTHKGHDASAKGHLGVGNDGADRKGLGYAFLSMHRANMLADALFDLTSGWIVWMTDHVLAPRISDHLELKGRYVFAPLPFFSPGSRVRLAGDGPSSWTVWIIVARTAAQSKWGTLPGGYASAPGWEKPGCMGGKPIQLMDRLVADYSRRGQTVLDPFMGWGTTGVAALNAGRKFIGIEIDRDAFDHAAERIAAAQMQGRLFQ